MCALELGEGQSLEGINFLLAIYRYDHKENCSMPFPSLSMGFALNPGMREWWSSPTVSKKFSSFQK